MSRRYRMRADRARTDGCWLRDGMHDIADLTGPEALLLFLVLRATGIPFTITRQTDTPEGLAA